MENMPLLPGYKFHDSTIQDYRLAHKLDFRNGSRVIRDTVLGPDTALDFAPYDATLTYGRAREYSYRQFIPHYALYAQKCLRFDAFFRQGVFDSPDEHYRVRHVNIVYYLEDDTLSVSEPRVENAGFRQGIHGVVYHVVNCDAFTREFLTSQGIDVGSNEDPPLDPYTQLRRMKDKLPTRVTPIPDDSRRRFLEYDKMVLTFDATWNDDSYQILYFLTDDTIAVREIHKPNDGKDPVAMLLKRTKVPKNWKDLPSTYPSIYMERSDQEVTEYYTPKDLRVGETIFIFGRRFLLRDCNAFTRKYYTEMLGIRQAEKIPSESSRKSSRRDDVARRIPPHINFGTPEDTLASCLSLAPRPPRRDARRQLLNHPRKLRYSMRMESTRPEDEGRRFVLEYNLSDGKMSIREIDRPNSGRRAGTFLAATWVAKSRHDVDDPRYYTPEDLFVGARVDVFNHRFVVDGADLFVYRYVEANPEKFTGEVRDNLRNYFAREGLLRDDVDARIERGGLARGESSPARVEEQIREDDATQCVRELESDARRKYQVDSEENRTPETLDELRVSNNVEKHETINPNISPQRDEEDKPRHSGKELTWADQIAQDHAARPIDSCSREYPVCKANKVERGRPVHPASRDQRPEVPQLMYESAAH